MYVAFKKTVAMFALLYKSNAQQKGKNKNRCDWKELIFRKNKAEING